jgi:YVTN family beta-propeller protein
MKSITTQAAEEVYSHSKKAFGIFTLALLLFTSFFILNQNAEAQPFAYVTNQDSNNVTVIDTATNMVVGTMPIAVGTDPFGVAITPDGTRAYVANQGSNNVSVIGTATNMVVATITVGTGPGGVAITPLLTQFINLSPNTATNDVLTNHTVLSTVEVNGIPQVGDLVTFEVISGPNAGLISMPNNGECFPNDCTTDANGQVSWTYSSVIVGTDRIVALFVDMTDQVIESNLVEKIWVNIISLSPATATNDTGTGHTVTATVEIDGIPEAGGLITFEVISGPNTGEISDPNNGECTPNDDCTTDGNGQVSWTYRGGKVPGTDTIVASFFDEEFQVSIESNLVEKIWESIPIPTLSE